MVSKTIVTFVCDMCGKEAEGQLNDIKAHTITIDGKGFEVDLCEKDLERAIRPFDKFRDAGRPVGKNGVVKV